MEEERRGEERRGEERRGGKHVIGPGRQGTVDKVGEREHLSRGRNGR